MWLRVLYVPILSKKIWTNFTKTDLPLNHKTKNKSQKFVMGVEVNKLGMIEPLQYHSGIIATINLVLRRYLVATFLWGFQIPSPCSTLIFL